MWERPDAPPGTMEIGDPMKKMVLGAAVATAATLSAVVPAVAANLANGSGQACSGGTSSWHFVNNQTGGGSGALTVTFNVNGAPVTTTVGPSKVLRSTVHYDVTTYGSATLVSASTPLPGRLVLSDYSCGGDPKKDDPAK